MKKAFKILLILFIAVQALTSCTVEHISNGKLDGFWHFVQIDTLSTGHSLDLSNDILFWGFQADLMHTQGAENKFYFRFSHEGNLLTLYSPYLDHGHQDREDGGDIPVEDPTLLHPYGIQSLEDTFYVETLSGSTMVLSTAQFRLHFIKF